MKPTILLFLLVFALSSEAGHYDWSMWRYDHGRTATTPEQLADRLYLQWTAEYGERTTVWDDPLNQNLMQFDRLFEPIVVGGKMFIGFNDQDKVVAIDLETGRELWQFFADGPVRLPLASCLGNIYFTSDDGFCYCLDAETGAQVWKHSLAPGPNKLLGNRRLISMWPARGGIVIRDNIVYTAASVFPMMGTFIYALDASTGNVIWKNDGTSSNYILQPHKSPAFADVAPQGSFTISGNTLLVAGGRSVPAAFDLKTGEKLYYKLAESGKSGGAFTCANDKVFFNHHRERLTYMYDTETGDRLKAEAREYPVVDGDTIYFSGAQLTAGLLTDAKEIRILWESDIPACCELIKAGRCLYAADSTGTITAIRLKDSGAVRLWSVETGRKVERLVASNGKLVAVTEDGAILVFGDSPRTEVTHNRQPGQVKPENCREAEEILRAIGITSGYSAFYGPAGNELLNGLAGMTELSFVVFDHDLSRVEKNRRDYNQAGIISDRISFLPAGPYPGLLPRYFSSLTVINDISYLNGLDPGTIGQMYESVRPYGGAVWIRSNKKEQKKLNRVIAGLDLYGVQVENGNGYTVVRRNGALKGSADWTHNYGNISNTVKSDDEIVKAPLGILWFGGNSNMDVLPRHGHGPSEQVVDGYLVIQGISSISARDVYTGRLIWKKEIEGLKDDNWMVYYDETYDEENPLDPKYNQVHIPGANSRGTNYIVTREYVYVIEGNRCHLLDLHTGEEVKTFTSGDEDTQKFAYIGVYDDLLILGKNFTEYPKIPPAEDEKSNPKFEDFDLTASRELMVLDRFTGEAKWSIRANHGFIHNTVIAGKDRLYCLDKLPQLLETKLRRRGQSMPEGSRLLCLDIKTGRTIREDTENIFGTWLGYSAEYDLLLQATRPSRDMLNGEEGKRMIIYKAATGEVVWDRELKYANPPIISGDKIYTNGEGFSLLTGDPIYEKDPVTGEEIRWNYKREYGCGYVVASEHLLTFRSASAAFVNLNTFEGTGSLGGFKAGCSANLIVANGVLNSPDYTRTCQCPYQNQTSVALIHMPWMNYWTNSNYTWNGNRIRQLGLNLNAPGDRTSDSGTLWIDYPNVGGAESEIPILLDTLNYSAFRKDPITILSEDTQWISASSLEGIRTLEITLSNDKQAEEAKYRVNLYFAEPVAKKTGERVFNLKLQGQQVLENFDIIREAGQPDREIRKSFSGVKAGNSLKIDLDPVSGNTLLAGVEVILEE